MVKISATRADIYFIRNNPEGLDIAELAKATKLKISLVRELMTHEEPIKSVQSKPPSQFEKALIKHPTRKGVAIMTEAASQAADEAAVMNKKRDTSSYITRAKH